MSGDGALTFREFVMGEAVPLATINQTVLEFLRERTDAVCMASGRQRSWAEILTREIVAEAEDDEFE